MRIYRIARRIVILLPVAGAACLGSSVNFGTAPARAKPERILLVTCVSFE
jgi:hypothetical protein